MASHYLEPSIKAYHQGDPEAMPGLVLTVASGDAAAIDTAREVANAVPEPKRFHIPRALQALRPNNRQKARRGLREPGA